MNKRECETCIKKKTIYCPNSNKCLETKNMPYYQNRIMLLEENKKYKGAINELMNYIENNKLILNNPNVLDFYLKVKEVEHD